MLKSTFMIFFLPILINGLAYGQEPSKPVEISQARDDAYPAAPVISIPLKKNGPIEYSSMTLVPNDELGRGALKQREFAKAFIEAGDSLEINACLIADRAADAFNGVEKGPDMPLFAVIQEAFNSKDTADFLKQIRKLAEQRKAAKTKAQLREMVEGFGGNPDNPLAIDYYSLNDYLYGTGFLEVSSKKLKQADPKILYYVPIEMLTEERVTIDLARAKMEVLKGITYFAFSKTTVENAKPEAKELADIQAFAQSCALSACSSSDGLRLGDFAADMFGTVALGRKMDLDETNEALLDYRKQLCILSRFFTVCPAATQAARVNALIKKAGIQCDKLRSLLKGVRVKQN